MSSNRPQKKNIGNDCLVQPPISQSASRSIGEGASSLFGEEGSGVPKMSLALEQPRRCTGASLGYCRPRDIFRTPWPSSKTTTCSCSFSHRFRGAPGIRGLHQAIRVASLGARSASTCRGHLGLKGPGMSVRMPSRASMAMVQG